MARVQLPPGCFGVEMADGRKISGKPGTHITVDDRDAHAISKSRHAGIGLLSSSPAFRLATKRGRRCPACRFSAQAWTMTCPRCGSHTEEEETLN